MKWTLRILIPLVLSLSIVGCGGCDNSRDHVIPADEQVKRFRQNQTEFERYVKTVDGLRSFGLPFLPPVPESLRALTIVTVKARENGDLIVFEWSSHALDSHHYIGYVVLEPVQKEVQLGIRPGGTFFEVESLGGRWYRIIE